jgi:predicted SAM-dependent methyltransferase
MLIPFKGVLRKYVTAGVWDSLSTLKAELKLQRQHRRSVRRACRYPSTGLRLNLGCGANLKQGWINIDTSAKADLQLDLREPLPFANDSAEIIYSEHFFEHLEYPTQAIRFLTECWRVLQPSGCFFVCVPETEWPLRAYANGDSDYFDYVRQRHPYWCNTRMHNINYHFRQGREHKYAYDFETLDKILEQAGFTCITRRPFNPDLDNEYHKTGTLYVDARKP